MTVPASGQSPVPAFDADAILAVSIERAENWLERRLLPGEIEIIRAAVTRFCDEPFQNTRLQ